MPLPMRKPRVRATAAEEQRAVETAKEYLYWTLVSDRRWADSRWSGKGPEDEWAQEFRYAMRVMQKIINDPECDSLLRKYAPVPGARKELTRWLWRSRRADPPPRKKGKLREQMTALRSPHVAYAVALVRHKHIKLNVNQACESVAKAVRDLKLTGDAPRNKKSVQTIWGKYQRPEWGGD
jgi:hypothetical protein